MAEPDAIANVVHAYLRELLAPIERRVATLETREAAPGRDGRDGVPGRDGAPGADGKDGAAGKDGADGLDLTDFAAEFADGGRTLVLSLGAGDVRRECRLQTPFVVERGVYDAETAYLTGDGVTKSGCYWIAQRDNPGVPGAPDAGWRLAVRKGRDGKDGKDGERGPRGPDGRPGRDLTQLGFDGSKH